MRSEEPMAFTTPTMESPTVRPGAAGGVRPSADGGGHRPGKRFDLLDECRELVLVRLTEVIAQALNKMSDELTADALRSMRSDHQKVMLDAVMLVRESRLEIETRFRNAFGDVFERRLYGRDAAAAAAAAATAPAELQLVSDAVISDKLAVDRLIGRARSQLDPEEVLGIRARLGALVERDWFEENKHPVSPEAVFEALKTALGELSPQQEVKDALLEAFEPHVSSSLNQLYATLNERLRANQVLPRLRPQVVALGSARRGGGAAGGAGPSQDPGMGTGHGGGVADAGTWHGGHAGQFAAGAGMPAGYPGLPAGHPGTISGHPGLPAGYPAGAYAMAALAGSIGGHAAMPTDPMAYADGAAAAAALDGYAAIADPLAALQMAMTDASAGRPAGRVHVARMLTNPAMFGVADIPVAPVQPPLVESLTALQRDDSPRDAASVIPAIAERVREKGSPLDQITVEIVSMVFDYIYSDRRLSDPIKQQLLRLQVVAVKAALLDRSFFARRQHPMRRLIDRISEIGADPDVDSGAGSPLIEGLGRVVDRIVADFDTDLATFDAAFASIEALAGQEADRRAAGLEAVEREAALQEALALAQDAARAELGRRVDKDCPPFVRDFLHRTWSRVLARARTLPEASSAERAWEAGLSTADHLIWSVAPKQSDEIPKLATVLSGLIRSLNQGLAAIDASDDERAGFFDELLRSHTLEIAAAKKRSQSTPRAPQAGGSAATAAQPGAAAPQPAAAVSMQADGSVRFVPRRGDPGPARASVSASDELLAPLARGQHIEIDESGDSRVFKLAWISPARKLFILTRHPDESRQVFAPELAYMLQCAQARLVDEGSSLERAIGAVTGESPAPQDVPRAADAAQAPVTETRAEPA